MIGTRERERITLAEVQRQSVYVSARPRHVTHARGQQQLHHASKLFSVTDFLARCEANGYGGFFRSYFPLRSSTFTI